MQRKRNSTSYPTPIPLFDAAGAALGSGVTPTLTIEKNGGAAASPSGTITATNAQGTAYLAGHATDRNTLGPLVINVSATGAESYKIAMEIVSHDPFDAATEIAAAVAGNGLTAEQANQLTEIHRAL